MDGNPIPKLGKVKKTITRGRVYPFQSKNIVKRTRSALRAISKSPSATLKRDIQAILRQIVIIRDGGCYIRNLRHCGGLPNTAGVLMSVPSIGVPVKPR